MNKVPPNPEITKSPARRSPTTLAEELGMPAFTQLLITKDQNYQASLSHRGVVCAVMGTEWGYV